MSLDQWLAERLSNSKDSGLYRTLRKMEQAPGRTNIIDGRKQLVFSSNNYLGLAADLRVVEAAKLAIEEFGTGSSGSRLTTGNASWHEKLEGKLASFKQTEAALLFSSGYLANIGVLSSIPQEGDIILSDELNHASLIDGCRLSKADKKIYPHLHMEMLEKLLKECMHYNHRFIVTDGVFSMDGTIAPLDKIRQLADTYDAYLIVDDAHGTGVTGETGIGTCERFGVACDVIIGTLSKAVGCEGGFAAGSRTLIDFLRNHARSFIFQTSIPQSSCAAAYTALTIIESDKSRLQQLKKLSNHICKELVEMGFYIRGEETPIIPVIIGDTHKATKFAEKLQAKGIFAPAIRPPTVAEGEARIRVTVTADHTEEDINYLLHSFYLIGREMCIIQDAKIGSSKGEGHDEYR
ncbi:8-amino-7-oxononanoate synthase [Alkalihalophilus pseudofirmus]|uniref:8-amino-7-ketopelargonate synthase n=1 Tax=Alkalihalophilus pseudofirmus TaxID=79885 RepID=A0AAJ2NKG0_ALKPS|nr:8-amino-7-oxononanoate synthase [Alkalihalophilus pseudofirmus]MDV2884452.1 8-amino-7-oxononanoate synthase [Alkalihalophilus pseudofirmus]